MYVDDLLITRNDPTLILETEQVLHHHFKIKELGMYALELILDTELAGTKP